MKKRNTIIVMLLSVIALTSCLDTLKQYCFHMYPNDYEYNDDYHYVICKICKEEKKEEHEFDEPYIVEYPTEDKKGLQEYYCIHCPYTKTEEIDKLVHEHSYDWTFTYENHWKEAKCGCDLEYLEYGPHTSDYEYETNQYKVQDATCMNGSKYFYTCRCGWHTLETFELDDKLDHKFINYTSLEDGSKISYCEYGCGTTDIIPSEEHIHVFNVKDAMDTHFAAEANCQHGLLFYYSCECDANGTETFEVSNKLDHKYTNYVYNNDATEYEDGTETAYCDYGCGTADTRVKEGSKLEHVHVFDLKDKNPGTFASNATCQEKARFYYSCVCGERGTETFEDGELVDHYFENYVYNNDATEYEDGTETANCYYGCGETDTRVVVGSALGHTHVYDQQIESPATFSEAATCEHGTIFFKSCKCGEIGTETFDDGKPAHYFILQDRGDPYVASSSTCQHGVLYYYSCVCGEKGTETFEIGDAEPHKFFDYVYDNNATIEADGTETAYCCYGCGTTDTRVKEGTALGHVHVYNVKNNGDYYYVDSPTCQHGYIYYYSCECGERGTETWDDGNIGNHNYKTSYFWLENNTKVSATAYCLNGCGSIVSEEVGTTYSVEIEPTSTSDGVGCYTTLPFDNDCFWTQTKRVVITYASVDVTGNSVYGYNDLINFNNGEAMQDLYDNLYNASMEFSKSTKDVSTSFDGLYVIEVADFGSLYLTAEEALSVWKIFYIENPGFYWLANTVWTSGNNLLLSIDESYANYSYREQCDKAVYDMVQDCKDYLENADNEIEKAKLVHDFIVNRIDYAYEADGVNPQDDIWAHNIIGAAMYEYGVCETYAKTYLYLCLLNGVDCIIVTGYAGGPHAWNYICINDKWYAVDCTWDDQPYGVIYNFFGVSKQDFSDHTPDKPNYNNGTFLYNLPELNDIGLFN